MKYKQRLLFAAVALPLSFLALFAYFHFNRNVKRARKQDQAFFYFQNPMKAIENVVKMVQSPIATCDLKPALTADWLVDEIYDEMNFTTNPRDTGGLYVLHDKEKIYDSPPYRKTGKEKITVIVVPHSHNDPGWLWTLDTYYTVRTRHILTNTVNFLSKHPDFKMIWTEMVFLDIWWQESSEPLKSKFKELVLKGQLEILSGGWVSVDEATTHYSAVLDQLVEGHMWLQETLGVYPNISWSIDPFGYSTSLPYLWRKSGMKDMAILRLHGALKQYMGRRHLMTFNWRQSWDSKGKNDILCHVEPYTLYAIEYICGPDQEFCKTLDFGRQAALPAEPWARFPIGHGKYADGLKQYVDKLVEQYRLKADNYKHNVLLMPHGDDFRYIMDYEFQSNYDNMKRLMDFINKRSNLYNMTMRFGTVGEYFDLLHESISKSKEKEESVTGDFFTYTDRDDEYWSGYYTTRPFDKRMIRYFHELLKATEIYLTFAQVRAKQSRYEFPNLQKSLTDLQSARRTHGLVQHHDAITGTSAASTVKDFENRISAAIEALKGVLTRSIDSILLKDKAKSSVDLSSIDVQKQPDQPVERRVIPVKVDGTQMVFTNSHSQPRTEIISLIVNSADVMVLDQDEKEVQVQVNPCWSNYNQAVEGMYEIFFPVHLPAMSVAVYVLKKDDESKNIHFGNIHVYNGDVATVGKRFEKEVKGNRVKEFRFDSGELSVFFSGETGLLKEICRGSGEKKCSAIDLDWIFYKGDNNNAYCMGKDATPNLIFNSRSFVKVVTGKLVTQVTVNHRLLQHTVTLYNTDGIQGSFVYIENVATLTHEDDKNKELLMRLSTSVKNDNMQYYTDENSFQYVSRVTRKNYPMAANYFPITSHAFIQDSETRLNVHSAQPVGVGSFKTGSLEFLIDRVPTFYGKGLDEAVTDNKPTLSKFIIHLEAFDLNSRMPPVDDPRNRLDFSSWEGYIVNDLLNNPIIPLYTSRTDLYPIAVETLLQNPVPCELSVANFRHFITNNQQFLGTGLTFHKRFVNCHFKNNACPKELPLDIHNLFKDLKLKKVRKMSLTHLHEERELDRSEPIDIKPMELESFYLTWDR
ncbi:hypothetical protein FSP39_019585 [Pinctada imbricata]|uniref:Alpha-mannosidase n=1 Tax=Pinctada imbricata TaxID=66713 RepID=A0AA88XS86_PINIB|nr:hypothetical protein FSP39_019585 [Pinctada imbricata]